MAFDVYIKKYFWVLTVVVVMVCSALAAKAVGHVIEAKALPDSDKPVRRQAVRPRPATSTAATAATAAPKSGTPLAERNIFNSDFVPETPVAAPVDSGPSDPNNPPLTALPLRLVATHVSSTAKGSFATVLNTTDESTGAYWIDDEIPGAGPVVRVAGKFVDFDNQALRRRERISLLTADKQPPRTATAPPPKKSTRRSKRSELAAAVDAGVRKVDDNSYEVDRSLIEKVLANPTGFSRGARIVPSVKNGQPNGFKLYAIRPSSTYAKIGLMNGDTLHAVNGFELNSMDKALEVYTRVRESSNLSVSITRRGKPVTLTYTIK